MARTAESIYGAVPLRIFMYEFLKFEIYEGSHEFVQILVEITFAGCIRIVRKRYEIIRNATILATIDVRQHPYVCDAVRFIYLS